MKIWLVLEHGLGGHTTVWCAYSSHEAAQQFVLHHPPNEVCAYSVQEIDVL